MKKPFLSLAMLLMALTAWAQMADPVHFSSELKMLEGNEAEIIFTATIDPGWHVYSTDIGDDGPTRATFHADRLEGAELVGQLKPRGKVKEEFDPMFEMSLRFFELKGAFVQKIRFTKPKYDISCYLEYGTCNDQMCMPPSTVEFSKKGDAPKAPEATQAPPSAPEGATIASTPQDSQIAQAPDSTTIEAPSGAVGGLPGLRRPRRSHWLPGLLGNPSPPSCKPLRQLATTTSTSRGG